MTAAEKGTSQTGSAVVRSLVDSFTGEAAGAGDFGGGSMRMVRGLGVIQGQAYPGVETLAERDVAVEAASALADFGIGWFCLIVLCVVVFFDFALRYLRQGLSNVPMVGGGLGYLTDFLLSVFDPITEFVISQLSDSLHFMLAGFVTAVQWAVLQGNKQPLDNLGALIQSHIYPVKHEVDHLWGWVNDINTWVNTLSHEVHGTQSAPKEGTVPLWDQIHAIQHDIAATNAQVENIHKQIADLYGSVHQLDDLFRNLNSHVHGVRAVDVGWQDVEQQIGNLQDEILTLTSGHTVQIGHNSAMLSALAPLGLLLAPGAAGLENLRKLEDDICQCPRLPGVQNELGLAMAVLHHLKGD
jgi:uncharacterized protein YoxC